MKKIRKYTAFALAMGLMLSSMTVMAEEGNDTQESGSVSNENKYSGGTVIDAGSYKQFEGSMPGSGDNVQKGDYWWNTATSTMKQWNGSAWVAVGCDDNSSSSSRSLSSEEKAAIAAAKEKAEAERAAQAEASREAVRMEAEAAGEGFENAAHMQYAQAASKSAGEYYNNAVVVTEGIEEAIPVAQGGNLVVDGQVTNMTASISKVSAAFVDSVRAAKEGTVLNVVDVQFPSVEATINFYMPGVADGANIAAVQYTDGAWTDVEVESVRADHVVLNLKGNGIIAFLAK